MNLRDWVIVALLVGSTSLVGCVVPATKDCTDDDDCFAGETCNPAGLCVRKSRADGSETDTRMSRDGGNGDAETSDTEDSSDVDGSTVPPPTDFYYFTSGGGHGMSMSYDVEVRVGAPTAGFRGQSDNYEIQLAPIRP